jgi:hypothetical protein
MILLDGKDVFVNSTSSSDFGDRWNEPSKLGTRLGNISASQVFQVLVLFGIFYLTRSCEAL